MAMRVLFTSLSVLLLAVALGWGLQQASGEVVFTFRGWIIQTSLIVFALAFIILFLLVYVSVRTLEKLRRIPSGLRRWSEQRRDGRMSAAATAAEELALYAGLLRRAGAGQERKMLETAWRETPRKLKKKHSLIGAYVSERLRFEDSSDCEALLRRALKRQWGSQLVRLYGLVEGKNLKRQLSFAENCLARFPEDPHLLLTLGRLCIKNHLWGKARSYLEQSLNILPDPGTCRELATLLEQQGEHEAASACFRQGLNLATEAPETSKTRTSLVEVTEG